MFCFEVDFAVAPVDDVPDARKSSLFLFHNIDDLKDRSSRCHHVFDDKASFGWLDFKSSPEFHLALFAFGEERPDTQHPAHFGSHDNAADRRRNDDFDVAIFEMLRDFSRQKVEVFGVLQHLRALEILIAVKSGRELKMPFEQGFGFAEDFQHLFFGEFHGRPGN